MLSPFYHLDVWRINQNIKEIVESMIRPRFYDRVAADHTPGGRSALDVAVKTWQAQTQQQKSRKAREDMTNSAPQNVKVSMLARVDTTTAAICYTFHLLASNLRVLGEVRVEHTAVFSQNTGATEDITLKSPENLKALPTLSQSSKSLCGFVLSLLPSDRGAKVSNMVSADGVQFPTKGLLVQTGVWNIHIDPGSWPRTKEFFPEQWLVGKYDPLYPTKHCMATIRARTRELHRTGASSPSGALALVFVVRGFDIECAWDEWGKER
ncbi:hypothetical protein DL767_009503 [Monosporascus sp. MG133]|nr:hypothetical protein DL767_009503 [Monosporascus sp. MG133]